MNVLRDTLILLGLTASPTAAQWLAYDVPRRPAVDADDVEIGRTVYETHCWYCHGDEGDGLGPIADYLWPRPRDFTIASFKFRTTGSGELPLDEDLYRTISLGLPGTAMPEWRSVLSPAERWQVIAYIKTFAGGLFEDDEFDPYKAAIELSSPPDGSADSLIAAGRTVYERSDCWECHGAVGRGDGGKGPDLEDDWAYPIRPTDLELGWKFKGGSDPRDNYMRLSTGIDGTPMPSYVQTLDNEERWQVAYYVASLDRHPDDESSRSVVITARRVTGDLPLRVDDGRWDITTDTHIPLTGQATFAPRWQIPAVSDLAVRALYNDEAIALLLSWNDRMADTVSADSTRAATDGWNADDTYPVLYPDGERVRGVYADAAEVVMPANGNAGPALPHFVYGDLRRPVDLWKWSADGKGPATSGTSISVRRARGPQQPFEVQAADRQRSTGSSVWSDGRWSVVIRRPLSDPVGSRASATGRAQVFPIAFHVWDGSNGETGLRMALSSWYYLYLAEQARMHQYLTVIAAVIGTIGLELGLVLLMRRRMVHA